MPTQEEIQAFLDAGGARGYACTAEAVAEHFGLEVVYECVDCGRQYPDTRTCECEKGEKENA
jgi:hypothetical protein